MTHALTAETIARLLPHDLMTQVHHRYPHYPDAYYHLFARLPDYTVRSIKALDVQVHTLTVHIGAMGAVLLLGDSQRQLVVKISLPGDETFTNAYFNQALASTSIRVPAVVLWDTTQARLPYDVLVLEHLAGQSFAAVPQHLHAAAGVAVGHVLQRLHHYPADGFGYPQPSGPWSADTWLAALRMTYLDDPVMAHKTTLFTEEQVQAIEALTFFNSRLDIAHPILLHGDVGPANFLYHVTSSSVTVAGVIDPGTLIGGDPLFDLAAGSNNRDQFSGGVWLGYTAQHPLTLVEQERSMCLTLLSDYWTTCWQYAIGADHRKRHAWTLETYERLGDRR